MLAFFLAGTEPTLPIFIYSQVRFPNRLPEVLALSSCILIISFLLVYISLKLRRANVDEGLPVAGQV
jgi:spermidine/putrescine transport system permease protein